MSPPLTTGCGRTARRKDRDALIMSPWNRSEGYNGSRLLDMQRPRGRRGRTLRHYLKLVGRTTSQLLGNAEPSRLTVRVTGITTGDGRRRQAHSTPILTVTRPASRTSERVPTQSDQ